MFDIPLREEDKYLENYDYKLPRELIAQKPLKERHDSRLLIIFKDCIFHTKFTEILKILNVGDVLVFNNSKVLKTKLLGKKETGGKCEITLIKKIDSCTWLCFIHAKNPKIGTRIVFEESNEKITAQILASMENKFIVKFEKPVDEYLSKYGKYTLPPYIKNYPLEEERYQTIFAKEKGSLASPTAGLHFSEEILEKLKLKGVRFAFVTLHISLGTFEPVRENNILNHQMHSELFKITKENADIINNAKRLFVVGTTSLRVLESLERIEQSYGSTSIFIKPGYSFKHSYHGLFTNFHLPKSTLIMLVSAIVGRERIIRIYQRCIELKYRFFSFGDASFIFNDHFDPSLNLDGFREEI
ncbi:MAG: tRNA preQ1(34) S-adenosylmethionine ribosyltransferase-isomerase QueA [Candidatus Woesearchaeota archaeon]